MTPHLSLGEPQLARDIPAATILSEFEQEYGARNRRNLLQCLIQERLRQLQLYGKFLNGVVGQQICIDGLEHLLRRVAVAPLRYHVRGDPEQIRVRVAYMSQLTRAQEAQIRLLRQILNINTPPYPPADKPMQAPVPTLSPGKKDRAV